VNARAFVLTDQAQRGYYIKSRQTEGVAAMKRLSLALNKDGLNWRRSAPLGSKCGQQSLALASKTR